MEMGRVTESFQQRWLTYQRDARRITWLLYLEENTESQVRTRRSIRRILQNSRSSRRDQMLAQWDQVMAGLRVRSRENLLCFRGPASRFSWAIKTKRNSTVKDDSQTFHLSNQKNGVTINWGEEGSGDWVKFSFWKKKSRCSFLEMMSLSSLLDI